VAGELSPVVFLGLLVGDSGKQRAVKKRLIVAYKYVVQVKCSNKTDTKQKERSAMCGIDQVW